MTLDKSLFKDGFKDGVPICLGYFACAFSLGIAAANAGLSVFQGVLTSLLVNASAGEYAGFTSIAAQASYIELAVMTVVANARYLLMSCALSARCHPDLSTGHRMLLGFYITDELFGITIARPGYVQPYYTYGAILPATLGWAAGTGCGVIAGNMLPDSLVSALSVALYGMFIAVFIPPARENKAVCGVIAVSFASSWLMNMLPVFSSLSSGTVTIILTVAISAAAAILFPAAEAADE